MWPRQVCRRLAILSANNTYVCAHHFVWLPHSPHSAAPKLWRSWELEVITTIEEARKCKQLRLAGELMGKGRLVSQWRL